MGTPEYQLWKALPPQGIQITSAKVIILHVFNLIQQ